MTSLQRRIRTMTRADLDVAVEWAAREGWNPGLADAEAFHAADPDGFLIAEDAATGEPLATISAVRYGAGLGFVGFYIVPPGRRGQGHGIAIWREAMARLAGQTVGLDGVVAQHANYARSGFRLAWRNVRHGSEAAPRPIGVPPDAPMVVEASTLPLDALAAYDRTLFAAPREAFLRAWLTLPGHVALAAVGGDDGAILGLGVLRPCRRGAKIGPLFAEDEAAARALFAALAARAPAGGPLFLDVPEPNAAATRLAQDAGMTPAFETARMYTGPTPPIPLPKLFGMTTFELG